jgi:hypothetical protein
MKKLFTLALALLVAFGGYSQVKKVSIKDAKMTVAQEMTVTGDEVYQHVGIQPNMTRTETELDYTFYDWQTNTAAKNLTMNFPDGCVGMAYVISTNEDHTDRGTNIAIYYPDEDEWKTSEGLIEDHKTGFGCAARYGENGIVVVSRNPQSSTCEVYIIEDKDNLPHNSATPVYIMDPIHNPHFPAVMCTGPDHKHIHILVTGLNEVTDDGQTNPFYYFRSLDGGNTWDEYMTIDYLGREYCPTYGSGQDAYFMENTGGNRLDIVVNTRRGDGVVLTSEDDGNTWTRTEFYHHPGIDADYGESLGYCYPRWTSALWDNAGNLHVAYEIGGGTGDASSTSYYPGIGGVAYWNSAMPYHGEAIPEFGCDPNNPKPMSPGQPFIMDSAYIYYDIYRSWWLWGDAPHTMWPEFIGYVTPLDEYDQPLADPYEATEFNLYDNDMTNHGHYNGGVSEMPVLVTTPNNDLLVAVWMSMDDHNYQGGATNNLAFFKLFTRASMDGGNTWTPMLQLTSDFMYQLSECAYPQAAITGNTLVVACQMDGEPDSYLIGSGGDVTPDDNYYQAFTFDLMELFGYDGVEEEVSNITRMGLYPNPAVDQLNVTLNQNTGIVIYNIMGQAVMNVEGHVGVNSININELNAGIYFVSAGSETQKFIVK